MRYVAGIAFAAALAAGAGRAEAGPDFATCDADLVACDSIVDSCCYRDFDQSGGDKAIIIPLDRCHQRLEVAGKLGPPGEAAAEWCRKPTGAFGVGGSSQDFGMYQAYGLVYRLMQNDIDVYWIINPTKDPLALTANDQTYIASDVDMWVLTSDTAAPPAGALTSCGFGCTAPVMRLSSTTLAPIASSYDRKEFPVRGAFMIAPEDRARFNAFWKKQAPFNVAPYTTAEYSFSQVDLYEVQTGARIVYQDFRTAGPNYALGGAGSGAPVAVRIDYKPPRLARLAPAGVSEIWLGMAKLYDPAGQPGCKSGTFVPADAVFCDITENDIQAGVLVSGAFEWAWLDRWSDSSPCGSAAEITQHAKLDEFMTHQPAVRAGGSVMYMEAAVGVVESCPNMQFQGKVGAGAGLAPDTGGVAEPLIIRHPQNMFLQMSDLPPEFVSGAVGSWFYYGNGAAGYDPVHTNPTTGSLKRLLTVDRSSGANQLCTGHKSTPACDLFAQSSDADYQDMGSYVRHKGDPDNGIAFYMGGNQVNNAPSHLRVILNSLIAVPFATVSQTPAEIIEVSRSSPIVTITDGIELQYQGTYEVLDPAPAMTTYEGVASDATFEFPYTKGHLRGIETASIGATGVDYTDLTGVVFDAAQGIPPVSPTGCGSPFNAGCRTVFTNVTSGAIQQRPGQDNVPFFTTTNVALLKPFLGTAFTDDETRTLISRVLAGVNESGVYVPKLGGVDRSTVAVIESSQFAGELRPTIAYFGALDGMLHAVCAEVLGPCTAKGQELWAFLPRTQMARVSKNIQRIDGSPKVADMYGDFYGTGKREWRTILTFQTGSGDAGFANRTPSVFAVDITDPAAPAVLWEVTTPAVRGPFELGIGIHLAMGPVRVGGQTRNVVFAQTNNGGTGAPGVYLASIDAETGAVIRNTGATYAYPQPPRGIGSDPPVPDTGIPGGVAAIDMGTTFALTHVVMATLYGELYVLDAATLDNVNGTVPLFRFSGNYHPIGAAPTIYFDTSTQKLHAVVVSGGYADPVNSSWAPPTVNQYAVSVALDATSAPMLETGGDYGGERAFVIDLGPGNRAFAQALIAGNELFIVTDTGDVNSSSYGTLGQQTGRLSRYSLTGGTAITVNQPIAGGASGADFSNGKVYTGAANQTQKTDLPAFNPAGESVQLEYLVSTERALWLRLR